MDKETVAGIRRYQIQHELRVTGELDPKTLQAMHLQSGSSGNKRAGERDTVEQADQEFLAALEGRPEPIGEQMVKRALASTPMEATKPEVHPASEEQTGSISTGAVENVLENYLAAASDHDAGKELACFAEHINYFDRGNVKRESIKKDLRRTRALWPHRRLELAGISSMAPKGPGRIDARFKVRYQAANGRKKASGVAMREVTIEAEPDGSLKIAGMRNPES
jgi:hypothetical protein